MSKTATSRLGVEPTAGTDAPAAPEWTVETWLNHSGDLSLAELRGRVVVVHAFQMLCPGCVLHGIPQAQRVRAAFSPEDVAVIGLHCVFEHHEAMRPVSLRAFLHEYKVDFPVAVDSPGANSPIPQTMAAYGMRGTPTLLLVDHQGRLRLHAFGKMEDLSLGAAIAMLVAERAADS
ncbi:MAG: redoxin domain-containing protein [Polyangiaceae bacterium]